MQNGAINNINDENTVSSQRYETILLEDIGIEDTVLSHRNYSSASLDKTPHVILISGI